MKKMNKHQRDQMLGVIRRYEEGTTTEDDKEIMMMAYYLGHLNKILEKGGASAIPSKRPKGADHDEGLSP